MTFEIIAAGERVECDDPLATLTAAATLTADAERERGIPTVLSRKEIIITMDGQYNGKLTMLAREGRTIS